MDINRFPGLHHLHGGVHSTRFEESLALLTAGAMDTGDYFRGLRAGDGILSVIIPKLILRWTSCVRLQRPYSSPAGNNTHFCEVPDIYYNPESSWDPQSTTDLWVRKAMSRVVCFLRHR